jgi:type I restriction enzyme S subunit
VTYLAIEQALSDRWPKVEFRRVARIRRETNSGSEETLLALSAYTGVRPRPEDGGNQLPSENTITGYWVARPGDLVFNPMWALEGGVAVSGYRGALSTAYRVYDLGSAIVPRFAHYYFRSRPAIEQYRLMVRGLTTFDRSVSREDFEAMPMPLPPLDVQRTIADFLDKETKRIDELITKKQRMIELLDNRRGRKVSELLNATVEHGQSKAGPFPWVPLRFIATVHGGLTLGKTYVGPTVRRPYLRVANVQDGHLELGDVTEIDAPLEVATRHEIRLGDLLLLEGNGNPDNLGRGTIWRGELEGCLHQNHVHVVRPNTNEVLSEYLDLIVRTEWARLVFTGGSDVVGISTLSQDRIRELAVPLPPLDAQQRLITEAMVLIHVHNDAVRKLNEQLALLQERRQALITAAVTGQLDIPEVAA